MRSRSLAYLGAIVAGIQIGAALVASERVVAEVGAVQLGFWRYLVAVLIILPFWLRSRAVSIPFPDMLIIITVGVFQFGVIISILNAAVIYTSASRVALLFATLPLVTLILKTVVQKTRVDVVSLSAILLTILGVAALLGGEALHGALSSGDVIGLILTFIATVLGAICTLLYAPYLKTYGIFPVSFVAMVASLPLLALAVLTEHSMLAPVSWSVSTGVIVGLIGVSSGVGFLCWLFALRELPAEDVTAFLGLSPLTAGILTVVLNMTEPSLTYLVAFLFLFVGLLILTNMRGPARRSAASSYAVAARSRGR